MDAFERYDLDALVTLLSEDVRQSMPPVPDVARRRRAGPGLDARPGCRLRGFAPGPDGRQRGARVRAVQAERPRWPLEPWAIHVLEIVDGRIVGLNFFLDTETLFPMFGMPDRFDAP